jgi:hypothetical protein
MSTTVLSIDSRQSRVTVLECSLLYSVLASANLELSMNVLVNLHSQSTVAVALVWAILHVGIQYS